jgi:hypothetical protein
MSWKERLNCYDHQFHQYQQNEQSPLIFIEITEYKKTTTYDDGNPGPSWLVTDTDAGVQQVNGS